VRTQDEQHRQLENRRLHSRRPFVMSAMRTATLLALAVLLAPCARAAEVTVAVAANFTGPMQKIAAAFERDTGHKAVLAFGSTGRFYAQVRNGAPFQVLLAADDQATSRLEKDGLAVPGSRFTYATGRLVLWSATPGLVDPRGDVLRAPGPDKVAVADPKLAPYGAAAMQVIEKLGVADQLRPRLVQGESIGQAFQFVSTGNAAMGFVALSQVVVDGRITSGSAWIVPAQLHAPIRQEAVLLKGGDGKPAAAALVAYLKGPTARGIVRAHGYEL
jgi:molybdate transport system substrate-binding protein